MKLASDIKRFHMDFNKVLKTNKALNILNKWGCGWTDGGCRILAEALRHWLGEGELVAVWEHVDKKESIQRHRHCTGEWRRAHGQHGYAWRFAQGNEYCFAPGGSKGNGKDFFG